MADKPIIFSAPMVRALLAGTKTQTRRLLKPQPYTVEGVVFTWEGPKSAFLCGPQAIFSNLRDHGAIRYAPGDRLYVREAWRTLNRFNDHPVPVGAMIAFEADQPYAPGANGAPISNGGRAGRLRPSIHMPRWASRITLTVTEVRVQRLQEITAEDCTAEGIPWEPDALAPYEWSVSRFADLWNSLHGPEAWDANPWVVAVSFTVKQGNIDDLSALAKREEG